MRGARAIALFVTVATAVGTAIAWADGPARPPGHTPGQTPGQTDCPKRKPGHKPGQTPGHTPGHTPGQTGCPKPGGKPGRPIVRKLKVKPRRFRAVTHQRASIARKAGARIIYVVSEAGTARFTIARVLKGRRAHGRCVWHGASNRGKKCKRHVSLPGAFSHGAVAGRNKLRFTGRLNGRPLDPGRYTLAITVVDMTGDRSRPKHAGFSIKR